MQPTTSSDDQRGEARGVGPTPEESFAVQLRDRRVELGLTQTQLATRLSEMQGLELDGTAVTRIEKGDRRVRLNEAIAISTVLGVDLYEMIAPGPESLEQKLERAEESLGAALAAQTHWVNEVRANQARVEELRQALGHG